MNKPPWLEEQQDILRLLHDVLDKLDTKPAASWKSPPGFSIDEKRLPGLFVLGDAADRQWSLLQTLSDEYGMFSIHLNKKRGPYDPVYSRGRLRFNFKTENILRQWLQRPEQEPAIRQWQRTVDALAHQFPGDTQRLRSRCIRLEDKTGEQIVQAFIAAGRYQDQALSLRQISARCFWGQSKFLERNGGVELLSALYPNFNIIAKPLLVNICLPAEFDAVLFIENEDTYILATQGIPATVNNMALVYCAGYKASAQRIRQRDGVSLHYYNKGSHGHVAQAFEAWWFDEITTDWPTWFWGDLDYSGMDILKVLKQRFTTLQAWQPGYQPMLESLINNEGHGTMTADKGEQTDPGITGCDYADTSLLPAIRECRKFVDQEYVF